MKRILYLPLLILFLISGSILGYLFSINTIPEVIATDIPKKDVVVPYTSTSDLSVVFISDFNDSSRLSIINLQKLLQTNSVAIDNNEDPGKDSRDDYFGALGTIHYPFKEMEISDTDEITYPTLII